MAGKKDSPGNTGGDLLEENRLDNIARTEDHNWDPDKPARPKNRPILKKVECFHSGKKYIAIKDYRYVCSPLIYEFKKGDILEFNAPSFGKMGRFYKTKLKEKENPLILIDRSLAFKILRERA